MYEHPDTAVMDKGPGAVAQLTDQAERLHHQIGLLESQLGSVARSEGPERALDPVPSPQTQLELAVTAVAEAVERIIRLRDRLVV